MKSEKLTGGSARGEQNGRRTKWVKNKTDGERTDEEQNGRRAERTKNRTGRENSKEMKQRYDNGFQHKI